MLSRSGIDKDLQANRRSNLTDAPMFTKSTLNSTLLLLIGFVVKLKRSCFDVLVVLYKTLMSGIYNLITRILPTTRQTCSERK